MARRPRSILEEMEVLLPSKHKDSIIETRGSHLLESTTNFLSLIRENYPEDIADELCKRFILSIRNENVKKFNQGIKKLKEGKFTDESDTS